MSMSTPAGGGNRRSPTTRPGAKPKDGPEATGTGPDEPDIVITRPKSKAATGEPAGPAGAEDSAGSASPAGSEPGADSASAASTGPASPTGPASSGASTRAGSSAGTASSGGSASSAGTAKKSAAAKKASAAGARGGSARSGSSRPGAARTGGAKTVGGKGGGARTGGKGSGHKPVKPVNINQSRNWGPIILFGVIILLVVGIIGFGGYQVYQNGRSWEDRAAAIKGIKDYRKDEPKILTSNHKPGKLTYTVIPPVGGDHNQNWQRCLGDVYDAPIANEHAVHSEEHGAVWITYRPDLPKSEVDTLAKKVRGHDFTLMSPYPGLDKPISLQTWGYQLKLDKAGDPRIDQFIKALREVSAKEPNTPCSSGAYITETGTTPHDIAPPAAAPTS